MFEKKEDKLFGYAYGDLDAHDAQVFEAALLKDEVSAEEVKFLQSIKGDLVSFRDIPEMQYSKERLRDAILGQGLKPSRPGLPWLNWVLAPGAVACVFALGFVLMNGMNRKDPTLIGGTTVAGISGVGPKLPVQKINKPEPIVATNTDSGDKPPIIRDIGGGVGRTAIIVDDVPYKPRKQAKRSHQTSTMVATNVAGKFDVTSGVASGRDSSLGGSMKAEVSKDSVATSAPSVALDATLIVIDKDQDSGVGAPVATEVNDIKNVVIGG